MRPSLPTWTRAMFGAAILGALTGVMLNVPALTHTPDGYPKPPRVTESATVSAPEVAQTPTPSPDAPTEQKASQDAPRPRSVGTPERREKEPAPVATKEEPTPTRTTTRTTEAPPPTEPSTPVPSEPPTFTFIDGEPHCYYQGEEVPCPKR
jgi:hypothetical protein